jgi:3,4-dihydroxy-2-butanone 4-phosphate synthase
MMVPNNQERYKTAYTITVDYRHGLLQKILGYAMH